MKQLDLFSNSHTSFVADATDTRDESYSQLQPELGRRQAEVLDLLRRQGPLSFSEISQRLKLGGVNKVTGRIDELRARKLVEKSSRRVCSVTQRNVWTWKAVRGMFEAHFN